MTLRFWPCKKTPLIYAYKIDMHYWLSFLPPQHLLWMIHKRMVPLGAFKHHMDSILLNFDHLHNLIKQTIVEIFHTTHPD